MSKPQAEAHHHEPAHAGIRSEDIDLAEFLAVVWRHAGLIAVLCALAMIVAVVVSMSAPRSYEATVTIVPPMDMLQRQPSLTDGLGNSMLRSVMNMQSMGDIYVEILQSREVGDTLVERFDLMKVYDGVTVRSRARGVLRNSTRIKRPGGGAVSITVRDCDPNRCAAIANAYVDELDTVNKRLSAGEATSKRVFLETRLKEIEAKLGQIDNMLTREAKVQETLYAMLVHEFEMAKIEEAKDTPTIQVLDRAVVPEMPVARGTVRKGITAAVAAFVVGVFVAFTRVYSQNVRSLRREKDGGDARPRIRRAST